MIPAATGPEQVVVNGMSPSNRGTRWSNSGMVVEVRPEDIPGDDVLRMMEWQEQLEHDCWQQGGQRQTAPAQRMTDFVDRKLSYELPSSSYAPGLVPSPLHFWMPQMVASRLRQGFQVFGRQSRGFLTKEATVIAIETRTSSPVAGFTAPAPARPRIRESSATKRKSPANSSGGGGSLPQTFSRPFRKRSKKGVLALALFWFFILNPSCTNNALTMH